MELNQQGFAAALIAYEEAAAGDNTTAGKVHALRAALAAYGAVVVRDACNEVLEAAALAAEDTDIETMLGCGYSGDDGLRTLLKAAEAIRGMKLP